MAYLRLVLHDRHRVGVFYRLYGRVTMQIITDTGFGVCGRRYSL